LIYFPISSFNEAEHAVFSPKLAEKQSKGKLNKAMLYSNAKAILIVSIANFGQYVLMLNNAT
jgi:hypothetical protein